jgi:hypothetical protein
MTQDCGSDVAKVVDQIGIISPEAKMKLRNLKELRSYPASIQIEKASVPVPPIRTSHESLPGVTKR